MRRAGADERGPRHARRGGVGSEQPARLTRRRAARGACSVPCGARPRSALPGRRLLYCPTRRCRARADERRCANWRYRRASDHNAAVRCPRSHIYTSLKQYTLARYHILSHLSFVKKLSSQDSFLARVHADHSSRDACWAAAYAILGRPAVSAGSFSTSKQCIVRSRECAYRLYLGTLYVFLKLQR